MVVRFHNEWFLWAGSYSESKPKWTTNGINLRQLILPNQKHAEKKKNSSIPKRMTLLSRPFFSVNQKHLIHLERSLNLSNSLSQLNYKLAYYFCQNFAYFEFCSTFIKTNEWLNKTSIRFFFVVVCLFVPNFKPINFRLFNLFFSVRLNLINRLGYWTANAFVAYAFPLYFHLDCV